MKILQVSASYKPAYIYGGPITSVAKLSEQLQKAGCLVEVYTTTANGLSELDVEPGKKTVVADVPVTYFKRITKDHSHLSPSLLKVLRKSARHFDIVHIHAWWNLVSIFSALIAMSRNVPVVISPRGTLSNYSFTNKNISLKKLIHHFLGRRLLNSSWLHTTSIPEQQAMDSLLKPKGVYVIPNFVHLPVRAASKKQKVGQVFKLLFFSRIEEKKGLDILLESLADVNVPYHLTITGDGDRGYIDRLKKISADNLSAPNISWTGFAGQEKFEILRSHDLFILPSHDENFGNAVIECLSAGTAVLISKQVGLAAYVEANKFGWLCNTRPESVSRAINQIARHESEALNRISIEAPDKINKDFNEDLLVKNYINMYEQIIACETL